MAKPSLEARGTEIMGRIGLTTPKSATLEYAEYQPGQDETARVILVMPAADWVTMQAAPPLNRVAPRLYNKDEIFRLGINNGAWHPGDEPSIVAAQVKLNEKLEFVNVGVAQAGSGFLRIYLFWLHI